MASTSHVYFRPARFGAVEVRVDIDAEAHDVDAVVRAAIDTINGKGAAYLYLPLLDTTGVSKGIPMEHGGKKIEWTPFKQTKSYNIVMYDPTGKVPTPGTSIEGAHLVILSPDHNMCYLIRKKGSTRWAFIGGAVDASESIFNAVLREICEELGIAKSASDIEFPGSTALCEAFGVTTVTDIPLMALGNYHQSDARNYGKYEPDDKGVFVNDNCHFYGLELSNEKVANLVGTLEAAEVDDAKWFDLSPSEDGSGAIATDPDTQERVQLFWTNSQILQNHLVSNFAHAWSIQIKDRSTFQWPA